MLTTERLEKAGFLCVILIFSASFVKLTFIANLLIFVFLFLSILWHIQRYQEEQKLAKWKIESEKRNQERLLQKQHEEE
ncbi:hypothetical protein [Nostoc sp.]|uniref:hypothetical protein n=1 Tax=Nostoc sp. TaxID=1180 RepID=UPI002FFB87D5